MNVNKIQTDIRHFLKENQINEAIHYLENFIDTHNVSDTDFNDCLISISQKNRELWSSDIKGILSYEEKQKERNKITTNIQRLVNDIPLFAERKITKTEIQSLTPALSYLENTQNQHIVEVRGQLLNVDNLLILLVKEIKEKEHKLSELKQKTEEANKLKHEIDELKKKVDIQKDEYEQLTKKYEEIKKERQKTVELDIQIAMLRAKLEGKERELKVLRDSYIQSREFIELQRREIERYKNKYG